MSASQPWLKFYPTDWRADQALRVCSLAARGLWMEMLCIMHEATPYGHLTINGRPTTDAQLASLTGTDPSTVRQLTTELEEAGVFSRNRNGVIYSRRMTRDEKRRKDGKKAAETGGMVPGSRRHQATEKAKEKSPPPGVRDGVESKPPARPEARSQTETGEAKASLGRLDEIAAGFAEFYKAYPRKKDPDAARKAYVRALKRSGHDEIMAGCRRYAAECAGKDPQYVKHPSTWLNAGAWANEADMLASQGNPHEQHHRPSHRAKPDTRDLLAGVYDAMVARVASH